MNFFSYGTNSLSSSRDLWHWADHSPLQHRNLPHPPRWSPAPPPRALPREYCRTPQNGTTASCPGWPSVGHWWPADRSHPRAQQQGFCLYSAPERVLGRWWWSVSFHLFLFSVFSLMLRCLLLVLLLLSTHWLPSIFRNVRYWTCVFVSPDRWCV